MNELPINFEEINENENDETDRSYHHNRRRPHNDYMIGKNNHVKYLLGHAQLNIIKSQSDAIELIIVKEAKGGDRKEASDRSKNIVYKVSQLDSLILCDNMFRVNNADKFRVQNVKVIFKIPVGKVVYLDKSL